MKTSVYILFAVLPLCACWGCSKEQAQKLAEQVAEKASSAVESAGDSIKNTADKAADAASQAKGDLLRSAPGVAALVASGKTALAVGDTSHNIVGTYCRIIAVSPKHGGVFQIRSYANQNEERFPAYYFHANTNEQNLQKLAGQELQGQLFIQLDANGPVWFSGAQPVTVRLRKIEGDELYGDIVDGLLRSSDSLVESASGSFQASIQE